MQTIENSQDIQIPVTKFYSQKLILEIASYPTKQVSFWIHSMNSYEDGNIEMVVADEKTDELRNVALTPKQITDAFVSGVQLGLCHCSGYALEDLDNHDACSADLILQMAVYGEIVWG